MNSNPLEIYLAELYTDAATRAKFLADPEPSAREAGLSDSDVSALLNIDKTGLYMAAASYANKRGQHRRTRRKFLESFSRWWTKLVDKAIE